MKRQFLSILAFFIIINNAHTQVTTKGQEFWLGYMENLGFETNGLPEFYIYVYGEEGGEGNFTAPALPVLDFEFEYIAGEITKIALPAAILYPEGSEEVSKFGFKIETSTPVELNALHYRIFFSETSTILPTTALGSQYNVMAVESLDIGSESYSSFVVIATKDGTEIEIIPRALTLGFAGPNAPINITMDAGESFQVQAIKDLSGSQVKATNGEPIAVFGGARRANTGCDDLSDNHLWDQIYPTIFLGKEYVVSPFKDQIISTLKVLSYYEGTEVKLDGDLLGQPLGRGESLEVILSQPGILTSNQDIQVALMSPSFQCTTGQYGDPNMMILAPTKFKTYHNKFWSENFFFEPNGLSQFYVTMVSESLDAAILLDGKDVSDSFRLLSDSAELYFYEVEVEEGSHEIIAEKGVHAYAYGFSFVDAFAYQVGFEALDTSSSTSNNSYPTMTSYPNPTSGFIYLRNPGHDEIHILKLTTMEGQLVSLLQSKSKARDIEIDLTGYPSAMYLLQYMVGDQLKTIKIQKI